MRRDDRAFILLEMIVALTILGIGFSVLFASMSGSARNINRLEKFQHREQFAQNLLEELDLVQTIRAGDTARGTFQDGTRWRIEVQPFVKRVEDVDGIARIVLRLEWDGSSGTQSQSIETYRVTRNQTAAHLLETELRDLEKQN
jgi:prepilin-type N-terminal cleavage/methylation domain-containing protein